MSLCCYRKRRLTTSSGTFVSDLHLPFARRLEIRAAAIDARRVGRSEGRAVVHLGHSSHLWHVKHERYGADIYGFAGRVGERQGELGVPMLEHPIFGCQRNAQVISG